MPTIYKASDVTDAHISEAADMREGLYGGRRLSWEEVIDRLERSSHDEDWGFSMDSPAITHLRRRVNAELRERV